ncbi:MAG: hypothetical protein AAF614_34080 [Chloroflexota bacterium]
MTTRSQRPGRNTTWLQAALGIGSVAVTMVGANLIAGNDGLFAEAEAAEPTVQPLPQTTSPNVSGLAPIPTIIAPGSIERSPLTLPSQTTFQQQQPSITIDALPTVVVPNVTVQEIPSISGQGASINLNLAPIPDVVVPEIPQVVTTSKSSK